MSTRKSAYQFTTPEQAPLFMCAGLENAGKVPKVDAQGFITEFVEMGSGGGDIERKAITLNYSPADSKFLGTTDAATFNKMKEGKVSLALTLMLGSTVAYTASVSDYYYLATWDGFAANIIVNKGVAESDKCVINLMVKHDTLNDTYIVEAVTLPQFGVNVVQVNCNWVGSALGDQFVGISALTNEQWEQIKTFQTPLKIVFSNESPIYNSVTYMGNINVLDDLPIATYFLHINDYDNNKILFYKIVISADHDQMRLVATKITPEVPEFQPYWYLTREDIADPDTLDKAFGAISSTNQNLAIERNDSSGKYDFYQRTSDLGYEGDSAGLMFYRVDMGSGTYKIKTVEWYNHTFTESTKTIS